MKSLLTFSFSGLSLLTFWSTPWISDLQMSKNMLVGKVIYSWMHTIRSTEAEDGNFQFLLPISSMRNRVFGKLIIDPS